MTPLYRKMVQWSAEDGEFVATAPDFPGLSALASTEEEALRELLDLVNIAIAEYQAEGWPLPEASRSPTKVEQSGQLRLRLPQRLHALAVEQAHAEGVSLNALLQSFVAFGLGAATSAEHMPLPAQRRPPAGSRKVRRSR